MKQKQFINIETGQMIYNNHTGVILDVVSPYIQTKKKVREIEEEGYLEGCNALRKGRADYNQSIFKVELKDHSEWHIYKRGDYDKITNYKLHREMMEYQLVNNTFIIDQICINFGIDLNYINTFF